MNKITTTCAVLTTAALLTLGAKVWFGQQPNELATNSPQGKKPDRVGDIGEPLQEESSGSSQPIINRFGHTPGAFDWPETLQAGKPGEITVGADSPAAPIRQVEMSPARKEFHKLVGEQIAAAQQLQARASKEGLNYSKLKKQWEQENPRIVGRLAELRTILKSEDAQYHRQLQEAAKNIPLGGRPPVTK